MDDEFKLCWKNFQDNIASGFQNLYDRGDLVDVTLACDGKLLQAHKFVLAICSPYFQEIFITNPCKHPTIFLKDVSFNIMCELLEFMYQGVVNVKHTELQSFMKVGQQLQIKGLATNSSASPGSTTSEKSPSQAQQSDEGNNAIEDTGATNNCTIKNENPKSESTNKSTDGKNTPTTPPLPIINAPAISLFKNTGATSTPLLHHGTKRHMDFPPDALPPYARKQFRRSHHVSHNSSNEGNDPTEPQLEQTNDDIFLPHFAMFEGRYEGKRENNEHHNSASTSAPTIRNPFGPAFNFDYTVYKNNTAPNNSTEYPNELYMASDFSKNFGNHMEIPPIAPGEHWFQGKLEFMLSQRGKPLLVHDGHTFGIQYVRKDKKYWQCNLSRKFNCKARVTTTDTGEIIVTNNEHCHTEIRQHLRKDYQRQKVMMNAIMNLSNNSRIKEETYRVAATNFNNLRDLHSLVQQSHHFGSLQQQQHNTREGSPNETRVSDMEDLSMKRYQNEQNSNTVSNDDNDERPLDCGILSASANSSPMSPIEVLRKYLPNSALSNNNSRNLNNSSSNNHSNENTPGNNNVGNSNNGSSNNNNYLGNTEWKSKEESL